jgi:large subunit ribosomal protein L11
MAKEITAKVKLQIPAGQAAPGPPVGVALGPHGINLPDFVRKFNDQTKDQAGMVVGVIVTVYKDRSYSFEVKTPPVSALLKKYAEIAKGSGVPNKEKVGKVTRDQVREIAKVKMPDLNTTTIEAAEQMVMGSARSMGIEIVDKK